MLKTQDSREVAAELAQWAHTSLEEAREVYESELARLEREATVTTFLPVLAKRSARERLSRKQNRGQTRV